MTIEVGDHFGRYEIRAVLGAGGMGEVFRAYDPRLGREVAIKRIGADMEGHSSAIARFEQEARAASALNHPNIIAVYDIGEEKGRPFIVMELLEGQSLRSFLGGGSVSLDTMMRLALQIADGLAAAHERGIVHRDLKPDNVFITRQGVAKILDFGLALISQPSSEQDSDEATFKRLTRSGLVVGTIGYAAPEILSGGTVDNRADIFSFGAILYEMFSGRPVFRRKTAAETLAATLRDDPPPASSERADLPGAIVKLLSRCLQKDPANRYANSAQVRDVLRETLDSRTEAPPVRRPRKPLPAPRTPLLGREREVEKVNALVRDGARLVTLTGAGGSGKTRLALGVAAELQSHFRGEIFFVSLATIDDAAAVGTAIARAMEITVGATDSPIAAVAAEVNLSTTPALLILDNFEQVMGAASDVSELVAACPSVSVLITSRELLRLYGEHDVAVDPLPVPDPEIHRTAAMLAAVPSVALFVSRAKAADPNFRLVDEDAVAVAEICRRLDGLPLALELAAARVRMMPPRALLGRLDQSLQLLTSGPRDLPDRQHTLRRTIDWSYGLLNSAEQALFRRLSVFAGGFTLEAAEAVGDPFGKLETDLVESVGSLVDKSLLQRQEGESDERRFFMLQTIREYATSLLGESSDEQLARQAHAAYFLVVSEEAARILAAQESPEWLARLAREHDNFRAALDWLVSTGNAAWGLRMALALFYFWERGDHLAEGRRRIKALLEMAGENHDEGLRARALHALGIFAAALRDTHDAVMQTEMGLALHRRRGDHNGVAVAHNALGIQLTELGDFSRAARHLEDALIAWKEVANESGYARSLSNLAFVRRKQGEYAEARRLHEEAAARFDTLGDHLSSAWARNHQGDIARDQQFWEEATTHYESALEVFRSLKDDWGVASSTADLGTVACRQGNSASAGTLYREALLLFWRLGHRRGISRILEVMSILAAQVGEPGRALILSNAAAQLRRQIGLPGPITDGEELSKWMGAARAALSTSEADTAERRGASMSLSEVIQTAEFLPDRSSPGDHA
ncbi:MAG TPA: protein kinase [Thermoanaerobaculia bacterium]|nr:protein kinase [Thermoanaerobaculia bacterium]